MQIDTRTRTYVSDESTEMSYESVTILNPYFDLATSDDAGGTTAGGGHRPGVVATVTATPTDLGLRRLDGGRRGRRLGQPLTITMANDHAIVAHFIPEEVFFVDVQQGDPGYQEIMELAAAGSSSAAGTVSLAAPTRRCTCADGALIVRSMDWDGEAGPATSPTGTGWPPRSPLAGHRHLQHYGVASRLRR
ncbi:MAG: hypothetical protein U0841_08925 [Chloroflexia bacterium]